MSIAPSGICQCLVGKTAPRCLRRFEHVSAQFDDTRCPNAVRAHTQPRNHYSISSRYAGGAANFVLVLSVPAGFDDRTRLPCSPKRELLAKARVARQSASTVAAL